MRGANAKRSMWGHATFLARTVGQKKRQTGVRQSGWAALAELPIIIRLSDVNASSLPVYCQGWAVPFDSRRVFQFFRRRRKPMLARPRCIGILIHMGTTFSFHVNPSLGLPLYRQLMDQVRQQIAAGRLSPGDFLPSTRRLSQQLEINTMTVSKAYSLLERDGVVELVRGQGMRVRAPQAGGDGRLGLRQRQEELLPHVREIWAKAHQLALTADQVKRLIDRVSRESSKELPAEHQTETARP
jgi:GntR family transcriptional regulator